MAVCGGEPPPSPSIGLGLMSCVKQESHPVSNVHGKIDNKKKGFHPFRGLRKIFKKRHRTAEVKNNENPEIETRSISASHLIDPTSSGVHSGLSLSHDSVFCPPQHTTVNSSVSVHQMPTHTSVAAELADVIRRRRDQENISVEDKGLSDSPAPQSPTTADILLDKNMKETLAKCSLSTCSDGSLLSMASSDIEEDSRASSKMSLQEKRSGVFQDVTDDFLMAGLSVAPLSHSAARHKMAVRPKRKHAAGRWNNSKNSLPTTPEVNEDSLAAVNTAGNSSLSGKSSRDISFKSSSLPAGVTPGDTWGTPSEDGFFTRLLARKSGKKNKNVESRQRVQPLTIPALNSSKSECLTQEEKLPLATLDIPSLPSVDTCMYIVEEQNLPFLNKSDNSKNIDQSLLWISKEFHSEQSLAISVGENTGDVIYRDNSNKVSVNGVCISSIGSTIQSKKENPFSLKNESTENLSALHNSSVISISHDHNNSKFNSCNENENFKEEFSFTCNEFDSIDSTSVNPEITQSPTKSLSEPDAMSEKNADVSQVDLSLTSRNLEFSPELKEIDPSTPVILEEKQIDSSSETQHYEQKCNSNQTIESIDELQKDLVISNNELDKNRPFEVKAIPLLDNECKLSENNSELPPSEFFPSICEKKANNTTCSVIRQKSFSFKGTASPVDTILRKSFEGVSNIKISTDCTQMKGYGLKKDIIFQKKTPVVGNADLKPCEKLVDKSLKIADVTIDNAKHFHTSDVEIVLRRRPSREILKQKEEEPELLKVFARRSLKVKDNEEDIPIKSRDSDKENEDFVSDRKKSEYQRSTSTEDSVLSIRNVGRQRSKTLPELSQQKQLHIYKEYEGATSNKDETSDEPRFVRIQERKEEWEKRAQQALRK